MIRILLATATALFAMNASAAVCANGDRNYDPAADTNEPKWEVCVNGKWQKEGAPAYISKPAPVTCKEGTKFYDAAADNHEPKWYVCKNNKFHALTVDGKIIPHAQPKIYTCKEGSGFYDAAADTSAGEPRFYVCRGGKFVVRAQ